ncbi:MAG TPA: hypothetical protein VK735_31355 [Pseudonocardia sp.]|uniref:hypothetical protein n=1 Tax=Pseudonocardia sp. TaxID=60912 RepID=UPI002B820C11|nr:hypothetical protein [Pseudonocardia sp.]HTF51965.1 hypothetical protein [Pseudonocardia sp.]
MTRRIRWATVAPLAALMLLGAAACGSGGAGSGAAGGGAAESGGAGSGAHPRSAQMQAFQQCLSEHGVTLASHPRGAGAAPGAAPGATPGATGGSAPAGGGAGRHRDMSTPPPGVTQQAWDSARAACASVAPSPAAAAPSTAGS